MGGVYALNEYHLRAKTLNAGLGGSVGSASDWRSGVAGSTPPPPTFFRGD